MSNKICLVDGCNLRAHAHNFCNVHYGRLKRNGNPLTTTREKNEGKKCKVDDCENSATRKGFCNKHYIRYRKHGDPLHCEINWHGMYKSEEYHIWRGIKARCLNKNVKEYKRYGSRGITICDRWRNSFSAFYEDMGPRPSPKHQIDRIDNDGNYEPGNCQWITLVENIRKKESLLLDKEKAKAIRSEYKPFEVTMRMLSFKYGVSISTIKDVIHENTWK